MKQYIHISTKQEIQTRHLLVARSTLYLPDEKRVQNHNQLSEWIHIEIGPNCGGEVIHSKVDPRTNEFIFYFIFSRRGHLTSFKTDYFIGYLKFLTPHVQRKSDFCIGKKECEFQTAKPAALPLGVKLMIKILFLQGFI